MSRVESPHSINVYRACPRKYYYRYHLKLPEKSGIAAVNGNVVHSTLEQFYKIDIARLKPENAYNELRYHLVNAFHEQWALKIPLLLELEPEKEAIKEYYTASLEMLENFFQHFAERLQKLTHQSNVREAFAQLRPETEVHFMSEKLQLQGFVDVIQRQGNENVIVDYKTSRSDDVTDEYRLQLGFYAALFKERFGMLPSKAGLYFLRKNTEKFVDVTQTLVDEVVTLCQDVHAKTKSKSMEEYPKNIASHCRFCDYQTVCFGQKSLQDFQEGIQNGEKAKGLNPSAEADVSVGR